jgi:hypothetical protein
METEERGKIKSAKAYVRNKEIFCYFLMGIAQITYKCRILVA